MKSILDRIFNEIVGNAKLAAKIALDKNLQDKELQAIDELSKTLSVKQSALFDTYLDSALEMHIYACNGYFRYGIQLGVKFILEAMELYPNIQ